MPVTTVSATIILQLMVIDGLTNATPALGFQETMTVLSLLCARVFGKFWHFDHHFSSYIQEGRGEKVDFLLKGRHSLYYDPVGTGSTSIHSLSSKALWLSSFSHHLGFLGNSPMEKHFSHTETEAQITYKQNAQEWTASSCCGIILMYTVKICHSNCFNKTRIGQ